MNVLQETAVRVPVADGVLLEARCGAPQSGPEAPTLVACHPHPLYGGDMDNAVVLALCAAAAGAGLGWLRFNFRGVGSSSGECGGDGEIRDVAAAVAYADASPAGRGVILAGYSFGAAQAAPLVARDPRVVAGILVAPPLTMLPVDLPPDCSRPVLVVVGEADAYCPRAAREKWLAGRGDALTVLRLPGVDHFFSGAEAELRDHLIGFLGSWSGRPEQAPGDAAC